MTYYQHLGACSDLAGAALRAGLMKRTLPLAEFRAAALPLLTVSILPEEEPERLSVLREWQRDGIHGMELSWHTGFGPETRAWLLHPEGTVAAELPGVLACHDHGGFKFLGKEKIADGPEETTAEIRAYREQYYGGRAYVNALARAGFAVLVHDTFLWGSRKFAPEVLPAEEREWADRLAAPDATEAERYNLAAGFHEHRVEKYARLFHTSMAALVARDDRIAFKVLARFADPHRLGAIGLSGGGNRTAMLQCACTELKAAVIVGLMSTYSGLLDHNMSHTWMLFPPGLSAVGDWPDLAGCRAPSPLLVQFDRDDELFTMAGMTAADELLRRIYEEAGAPGNYESGFFDGPHKFDLAMQADAFDFLSRRLAKGRN